MIKTVVLTLFTATASAALVIAAHSTAPAQAPTFHPCFKELPRLAKRVGLTPTIEPNTMIARGCDGLNYDVIALLNKLLDRLEQKTR